MHVTGNMKGISVIICCYNSEKLIDMSLGYLAKQQVETLPAWEIVLVNNNSKDNTTSVAENYWKSTGLTTPLRIIQENKQGLIHARKTGIMSAQYDLVVFCDDDNFLAPNYLERAWQIMNAHPDVGILGGESKGYFTSPEPEWLPQMYSAYALGKQYGTTGDVTATKGQVWGAGMVSQTKLLQEIFNEEFITTGRSGKNLASGDDTEICYKAILKGYHIYYDESLKLQHYITPPRLTWEYAIRLSKGHIHTLINMISLRREAVEKINESNRTSFKDLLYAIRYTFKPQYLFKMRSITNLKDHEGDFKHWKAYFDLYYIYTLLRKKILKLN
jgi:glycosyltransferase involved in cell wall biosynthesis